MNSLDPFERLQADLKRLSKQIAICQKASTAKEFFCSFLVTGTEGNSTTTFSEIVKVTSDDSDMVTFFHNYAQTLIGKRLKLYAELEQLNKIAE